MIHRCFLAILFLLASFFLEAQATLNSYWPEYGLDRDEWIVDEGLSFYSFADQTLYYRNSNENLLARDWLFESGVIGGEEDFSWGAYWLGSLFSAEGSLPEVENMDIVIDETERVLLSDTLLQGAGIWADFSMLKGELYYFDSDVFGSAEGALPFEGGFYAKSGLGFEPLARLEGEILGDGEFPLYANRFFWDISFGRETDRGEWDVSYAWSRGQTDAIVPDDGVGGYLDIQWDTLYGLASTGRRSALRLGDGVDWTWNLSFSESILSGEGRYYDEDYDVFIEISDSEYLFLFYGSAELGLSRRDDYLGFFGEAVVLSMDDRITLNAPSTIVSANYTYRYILDDSFMTYWQAGLFGRKTAAYSILDLDYTGSLSCVFLKGETNALEVYGLSIPFVSSPEQYDLGMVEFFYCFPVMNFGLDGAVDLSRCQFVFSLDQTVPVILDFPDFSVWGGLNFSCGFVLNL